MPVSVSVMMPAHKEAGNLEGAVKYVTDNMLALTKDGKVTDWEIVIVDSLEPDGSSDGTPMLADRLVAHNPNHIKVIHNTGYVNIGYKYRQGLAVARSDYFMMVPGKNTLHSDSLKNLLGNIPPGGIVIGYQGGGLYRRPLKRRIISKSFTVFMNFIFGLKLRYYNGTTVMPTQILREINARADDFAYMAEIIVILLKEHKLSYTEVPFFTRGRRVYGKTKAMEWQNVVSVAKTVLKLIKKIYFSRGESNV